MSLKGRRPTAEPELVLRTFLFSDIVSSTAISDAYVRRDGRVQGNGKYRREVLGPHDRRAKERFATFGGEVVGGEGVKTATQTTNDACVAARGATPPTSRVRLSGAAATLRSTRTTTAVSGV